MFRAIKDSVTHFFFPAKCLTCYEGIPPNTSLLCTGCSSLLELIDPSTRCSTCFSSIEDHPVCENCVHHSFPYTKMASAFDYVGPPAVLIKKMKYEKLFYLAKGMGAFLFAQFDRLEWPLPDLIVPVPISFFRWLERGFNQSALLAEELSLYLGRPCRPLLKRRAGDFSQARLPLEKREQLQNSSFSLSKKSNIEGKKILLIDDVFTTGSTLHCCADILAEGNPSAIYALTFCKTVVSF